MKKVLMTLMMICMCGAMYAGNDNVITEQKTIKVGEAFRVSMDSKPSADMKWRWEKNQNALVDSVRKTRITKSVTDPYYHQNNNKGGEVWTFRAKEVGTDTLTLYYKSLMGVQPVQVKKVCLTILPD